MNAIEIKDLTKQFKDLTVVDHLNLSIKSGEFFSLLGQNGAGKTTTIKMLCCLLTKTSGDALILGDSIGESPIKVKQKINVSPQETAVAPNLSVKENLEMIAKIYGSTKQQAKDKAQKLIAEFKLTDKENAKAKTLSGGMQRRLSIAMALISDPDVIFLDEPTLGLDIRARRDLWNMISKLKGKITIVLTTHYLEEAEALSDRIGIMHYGRMKALGTLDEILKVSKKNSLKEAFLSLTEEESL